VNVKSIRSDCAEDAFSEPAPSRPPGPKVLTPRRLLSRLDQAPTGGVTLVAAPAGYGKTQLVRDWSRLQNVRGTRIAWLDVAPDLREPSAFFVALGAMIDETLATGEKKAPSSREAGGPALRQLLLSLRTLAFPLVIVIDDYHLAACDALSAQLGWLLSHLNSNVRVILMARSGVEVTLGSQWLRSRVMKISATDLRLTDTELAELCEGRLDPRQIVRLGDWAEGWPAAIYMVLMLLRDNHPLETAFASAMSSTDRPLARYIDEQVLGQLPLAHQELLVQTAFLAWLDADMVRCVTDLPRSWEYLQDCDKQLAISPREESAESPQFRCHSLIREVLLARLAHRGIREIARLKHRAALCFEERGRIAEAVSCACAAREHELAVHLILASGGAFFGARHGWPALKTLLDNIPGDLVRGHPRLTLAQIYVLASEGRVTIAGELLQTIGRRVARGRNSPSYDRLLLRDLAFVEIVLGTYTSLRSADGSISLLETAVDDGDPGDCLSRGVLKNLLGWNHLRQGHFEDAGRCATAAAYYFSRTTAPFGEGYTHVLQGLVELEQTNVPAAIGHYEAARETFCGSSHPDASGRDIVDVFLAEAYYEQGRLADAKALCKSVSGRLDAAHFYPTAVWYRTMAALVAAEQGSEAGIAILDRGIELARGRGFGEIEQVLLLQRIELMMARGVAPTTESLAILSNIGSAAAPGMTGLPSWRAEYMKRSLGARLLLLDGHCEEAADLLHWLACECERTGRIRFAVDAMVLLAIAYDKGGSVPLARESLQRALVIGIGAGLLRPFIEHASCLSRLLLTLRADHTGGPTVSFINKVLAIATLSLSMGAIIFSQRELEILGQLTLKSENKRIARALRISPETVRFHLKNVYEKLGVKDRALVAEIARMRGVITSSAQSPGN
jgi:LuxR family maltose regulon positive regulatory protein